MKAEASLSQIPVDLAYHLLRCSLETFKKNLNQLDGKEYQQVVSKARKTQELESLVLSSEEAQGLVIAEPQLDAAVAEIAGRYENSEDFHTDLEGNGLSESALRMALMRELMFDTVMQKVAANSVKVTEIDARLFFEMHQDRFEKPEQREASHILITINENYAENSETQALSRIQSIKEKLAGRANRFSEFAKRYSECPTAMEGGKLGVISRGQLYPSLDEVLFELSEKEISTVVESEMGYHLLLCEKIKPKKKTTFSKVEPQIREILTQRMRRNCQKKWLEKQRDKQSVA